MRVGFELLSIRYQKTLLYLTRAYSFLGKSTKLPEKRHYLYRVNYVHNTLENLDQVTGKCYS